MSYVLNKTDGTTLTIINEGVKDDTTTSLTLFGKGYKDWGEGVNENFIKLLENFSNNTPPPNALEGQLWFDKLNGVLKFKVGSNWNSLTSFPSNTNIYYRNLGANDSVIGFEHDGNLVGIFSSTSAPGTSLTGLGNINFSFGVGPGLNLSINKNGIFGQQGLKIGFDEGKVSLVVKNNYEVVLNDSNSRLGIRTNFPSEPLQVVGTARSSNIISQLIKVSSGIESYYLPTSAGPSGYYLTSQGNGNKLTWTQITIDSDKIQGYGSSNIVNASAQNSAVSIITGGVERLVVTSGGLIGIGTNSPSDILQLESNVPTGFRIRNSNNNTNSFFRILQNNDNSTRIYTQSNTGPSEFFIDSIVNDSSSNSIIGIGRNTNTTGLNGLVIYRGDNTSTVNHRFVNNGNSYIIANNGNLGIGTTSPVERFHVAVSSKMEDVTLSRLTVSSNGHFYRLPSSAGSLGSLLTSQGPNTTITYTTPQSIVSQTILKYSANHIFGTPSDGIFAHGLGGIPDIVRGYFLCIFPIGGYDAGDHIDIINGEFDEGSPSGIQENAVFWFNSLFIGWSFRDPLKVPHRTDNSTRFNLTSLNWRLVLKAFRFLI